MKNPYEVRTDNENDEGGEVPSDDDEGSGSEDDNSGDNNSDDSGDSYGGNNTSNHSDSEGSSSENYDSQDSGNNKGEPPNDRVDEDAVSFYEYYFDDDVDYYIEGIEDDAKAKVEDYDEYHYGKPLDWSCIIDASSKLGPQYFKHGKEIPELGSFHHSEFGSLTAYTDEEDDINPR